MKYVFFQTLGCKVNRNVTLHPMGAIEFKEIFSWSPRLNVFGGEKFFEVCFLPNAGL
ncbi:MAG: hypothetical protein IKG61_07275 [Selenomonadaceae bacterium]|nr:hypothetical protein [Selenomonadaceae bacterium]